MPKCRPNAPVLPVQRISVKVPYKLKSLVVTGMIIHFHSISNTKSTTYFCPSVAVALRLVKLALQHQKQHRFELPCWRI